MKSVHWSYDNDQMKLLEAAIEVACSELRIDNADREKREKVAVAVLALARTGQTDPERLKMFAVSQIERTRDASFTRRSFVSPMPPDQQSSVRARAPTAST